MAFDAKLTVLGPARVAGWTCETAEELALARDQERALVDQIERELSRLAGRAIRLGSPLVPAEDAAAPADLISLPVGPAGGLGWLTPPPPGSGSHLAIPPGTQPLFIPLEFDRPFAVSHGSDRLLVASLPRALDELSDWLSRVPPEQEAGETRRPAHVVYARTLASIFRAALERGIAVELY